MRIDVLDGLRGFFLLFMAISHLNAVLQTVLGKINYHPIGWADSAHGFVFVSGLTVGLVYTRKLRSGFGAVRQAALGRVRKIYAYHLGLVAGLAVAALALSAWGAVPGLLVWYVQEPVALLLASALMVGGSAHMGILPMYVAFVLATPWLLRMLAGGHGASVAMLSAALWLLAQSGLTDLAVAWGEARLAGAGHPMPLGIYFDIAGWQLLYVAGLALGHHCAVGQVDGGALRSPAGETAFKLGAGIFVCLAVYDRIVYDALISPGFSATAMAAADRGALAPIYVLAFALDAFLLAWLLNAGPHARAPGLRLAARAVRALLSHPVLTLLGRHALPVFAWHIGVVYTVAIATGPTPPGELAGSLLLVCGTLAIFVPALALERRRAVALREQVA